MPPSSLRFHRAYSDIDAVASTREHRQGYALRRQEAGHGAEAHIHARRNVVAYLALVAALGAAGGVAYSSIPDAQGVIHGCYDDTTGALRVIDTDASGVCRGGETALDWNQQGQPGLHGHPGPAGPAGPEGPPAQR